MLLAMGPRVCCVVSCRERESRGTRKTIDEPAVCYPLLPISCRPRSIAADITIQLSVRPPLARGAPFCHPQNQNPDDDSLPLFLCYPVLCPLFSLSHVKWVVWTRHLNAPETNQTTLSDKEIIIAAPNVTITSIYIRRLQSGSRGKKRTR